MSFLPWVSWHNTKLVVLMFVSAFSRFRIFSHRSSAFAVWTIIHGKVNVTPQHNMEARRQVEVQHFPFFILGLDEVGGEPQAEVALPGIYFPECLVGLRAGMDGYGKSRPPAGSEPRNIHHVARPSVRKGHRTVIITCKISAAGHTHDQFAVWKKRLFWFVAVGSADPLLPDPQVWRRSFKRTCDGIIPAAWFGCGSHFVEWDVLPFISLVSLSTCIFFSLRLCLHCRPIFVYFYQCHKNTDILLWFSFIKNWR